MGFFTPPLFKWKEPDAHVHRSDLIKSWPKGLTLMHNNIDVYVAQIMRSDGKSVIFIPFNKMAECAVTVVELPGERPYFHLVFTPTQTRIWGIFGCNFLKETALEDAVMLEQVLAL